MRRIAILVAAAALTLGLAACGDEPVAAPAPTVTVTEAPEPESTDLPSSVVDEAFAQTVRDEFPAETMGISDQEIVSLGHDTCDALDTYNGDVSQLMADLIVEDVDPYFGGFVLGASVVAYCPEYQDEVEAFSANFDA